MRLQLRHLLDPLGCPRADETAPRPGGVPAHPDPTEVDQRLDGVDEESASVQAGRDPAAALVTPTASTRGLLAPIVSIRLVVPLALRPYGPLCTPDLGVSSLPVWVPRVPVFPDWVSQSSQRPGRTPGVGVLRPWSNHEDGRKSGANTSGRFTSRSTVLCRRAGSLGRDGRTRRQYRPVCRTAPLATTTVTTQWQWTWSGRQGSTVVRPHPYPYTTASTTSNSVLCAPPSRDAPPRRTTQVVPVPGVPSLLLQSPDIGSPRWGSGVGPGRRGPGRRRQPKGTHESRVHVCGGGGTAVLGVGAGVEDDGGTVQSESAEREDPLPCVARTRGPVQPGPRGVRHRRTGVSLTRGLP